MPLAQFLAPLVARKAQQIESDLGHAPSSYLAAQGGGTQRVDEAVQTPESIGLSPAEAAKLAEMQNNPMWRGAVQGYLRTRMPQPIPVTPPADGARAEAVVGMTDTGQPIYASQLGDQGRQLAAPRGRVVIPKGALEQPGAIVNEAGRPMSPRGNKLGYLDMDPSAVLPNGGSLPIRHLDKQDRDVVLAEAKRNMRPEDVAAMRRMYGDALEAYQNAPYGTRGIPDDFFDTDFKKAHRKDYIEGVKALMQIERELNLGRAKGQRI